MAIDKCIKCGSYAFNLYKEDIDQGGLCDVHYWQYRAHRAEALAEQPAQQEPVGYVAENGVVDWNVCAPPIMTDLYTSPPQRKPLTDEQWQSIADTLGCAITRGQKDTIETALGIKENT